MVENIKLEVNIPNQHSVICDASLKFEIKGTPCSIKKFEEIISAELARKCQ